MSASDLAIVVALVFAWGTLSARLERFDVTAPSRFVLAGVLLIHGPLAPLGGGAASGPQQDDGRVGLARVGR
jgi:hypothetical protein